MQTVKKFEGVRPSTDNKYMEARFNLVDGSSIELQIPQAELYPLISSIALCHTQLDAAHGRTHTSALPLGDADAVQDRLTGQIWMTVQFREHKGWIDFEVPLATADKLSKRLAEARDYKGPSSAPH